nr:polycystic kidney disease protein 1-like 3 [Coffea arabica]
MVRIRGGSTSAGRSFRLRDEDIEIVEPPPVAPKKKIVTRGKVKQTAQRKLVTPTAKSSDKQMEGQNSEGNIVGGNEEPEQATQGDETVTRSSGKRKRTGKRRSTPQSKKKQSADPSVDQQDEGNITENQQTPESFTRKNLLVPPIPENNANVHGKEPRPESTGPTTGTETTPASSSQPKDKGKAPATEEAYEDDDEETEEEEDPEQTVAESRRKNFHETPATPRTPRDQSDCVSPFTIHPRKSASKSFASNSEVISLLEDLKQHVLLIEDEPRPESTGPTTGTETTPASSSQPKDKGKAPAIEEAYEDDDEETEEEEDPE